MKTGKLCKVEIEGLKRQIKRLHVGTVESKTGEPDAAEEEFVTQSDDNALLQGFTARASGYVEDTNRLTKPLKLLLKIPQNDPIPPLRSADAFRLRQEAVEVSKAKSSITLNNISNFNNLIKADATIVCERMGIKKYVKPQQEPFSKRRIESDITRLKKDLSPLDDWFQGKWKKDKKRQKGELRRKYRIQAKGFKVVIEELKQRVSAKSGTLRRYCTRGNQYRQNKLFRCNQKALYQELGGKERYTQVPSNAEESKEFWSKFWDNLVQYKEDTEWLNEVELELEISNIQENVEKTKEDVTIQLRKIPKRKAPGLDGI